MDKRSGFARLTSWVTPTYHALRQILTNPVYAGAYTYGKTRYERYVDEYGTVRKRIRHLPMEQWAVLIQDHHPGFIDWTTFQSNQARLDSNTRPKPHQPGGAVRDLRPAGKWKVHHCSTVQDGHSANEQLLYEMLWRSAKPINSDERLITISREDMAAQTRITIRNVKGVLDRLIENLQLNGYWNLIALLGLPQRIEFTRIARF